MHSESIYHDSLCEIKLFGCANITLIPTIWQRHSCNKWQAKQMRCGACKKEKQGNPQDKPHRESSQKYKPRVPWHCLPIFCVSPTPQHFPVAVWAPCLYLLAWRMACLFLAVFQGPFKASHLLKTISLQKSSLSERDLLWWELQCSMIQDAVLQNKSVIHGSWKSHFSKICQL